MTVTLTTDQTNARQQLRAFYTNRDKMITLNGSAGSGKSTLLAEILAETDKYQKTLELLDSNYLVRDIYLTATTNKAVNVLQLKVGKLGYTVTTLHSLFSLRANNDFSIESVQQKNYIKPLLNESIIIIDEASMISTKLFNAIKELTKTTNAKIIFVGDSNQLFPVKESNVSPVFNENTIKLSEVVRQKSVLLKAVTAIKEYVETDVFPHIDIDGINCLHLNQEDFNKAVIADMSSNNWINTDSRVLAYKNEEVTKYNNMVKEYITGTSQIGIGETVTSNTYLRIASVSYPAGTSVFVLEKLQHNCEGVKGHYYNLATGGRDITVWMPDDLAGFKTIKAILKNSTHTLHSYLADLRPDYASTIHKAQGSTFKRVYIDLNSIKNISRYDYPLFKRLLYVAASRASEQIIFTGDLI